MPDRAPEPATPAIRNQAAWWLARLNSGECMPEDRRRHQAWLDQDERHRTEFERARALWDGIGLLPVDAIPHMAAARRRVAWPGRLSVAASLACLCIVLAAFWLSVPGDPAAVVYQTAKGERLSVTLADGSAVELNTETLLSVAYSSGFRTIRLDRGEALFTVAPGDGRPFDVIAGEGEIRDLGTRFSVHRDGDVVAVVVVDGAVTVKTRNALFRRPLIAGEAMRYGAAGALSGVEKIDVDAATAWSRGRLVFDDVTLVEMARQIARYHDIRIVIDDPLVRQLRVSGTFRSDDLDGLIDTLQTLLPIKAEHAAPGLILLRSDA